MSNKTKLNLPELNIRTRSVTDKEEVWDDIRKKWLVMTPEEWVRQCFIQFMCKYLCVEPLMIKQEHLLKLNNTQKRADIVIFGKDGKPRMVIECKAPHIKITKETLEQVARYNTILKVPFVAVTNGISHYCFKYDIEKNVTTVCNEIPDYDTICL